MCTHIDVCVCVSCVQSCMHALKRTLTRSGLVHPRPYMKIHMHAYIQTYIHVSINTYIRISTSLHTYSHTKNTDCAAQQGPKRSYFLYVNV